uniref:Fibronectin type III domain-containing protein n=1 Tax=Candidatus Kentrum sp. FM TaxID=2126340 RepID=A0A450TBG5_9GAMM|nr:MAG: Fibronectin type III domain-containing protein [Candidatus Kentron sp. FM]VFJ64053.1 MAG: Fibronectin type III domain-containing protein [Candidatus Kentron sp. FM]VFK17157.1 MAG: Fibronectin type III domain-containing protein [Candidatus Kentron sp. FM]
MATFPTEEEKIFTLGRDVSRGLKENSDIYPAPPIDVLTLDEKLTAYEDARGATVAAQAAAEQATANKNTALRDLTDTIKLELRYAEMTVNFDDDKLKSIGWGGRRGKTPLARPGQVTNLVGTEQGEDWIALAWKKPRDGGRPSTYEVRRREWGGDANWDTVGTATALEATLTGQERGKEWEYGVVAINRAGEGSISNTVMAVL